MKQSQFLRFVLTGGFAALVNLGSRYLLNIVMPFPAAVAVAYLCGMVTAYLLGRMFVFERSGRSVANEFWRFTLVNMVAAAQVWLISVGLGEYAFPALKLGWHPLEIAHFIGVSVPVFTSYLGHRHFSFAKANTPAVAVQSDFVHAAVAQRETDLARYDDKDGGDHESSRDGQHDAPERSGTHEQGRPPQRSDVNVETDLRNGEDEGTR